MNRYVINLMVVFCAFNISCNKDNEIVAPPTNIQATVRFYNSNINICNKTRAISYLGVGDDFTKSLSVFDVKSRLNSTTVSGSEKEYFDFTALQLSDWTETDIKMLTDSIAKCETRLKQLNINFNDLPADIEFIKSNGSEEFGAEGYTRKNCVILKEIYCSLIVHELFHIYTRYNPAKASACYSVFGFKKADNEILYPANVVKVTNPDAYIYTHYITVKVKETNATINVLPFIYSKKEYTGLVNQVPVILDTENYVSGIVNPTVAVVELKNGVWEFSKDNNNQIKTMPFAATDIYDYIGKNTSYSFHNEELTAANFQLLYSGETASNPLLLEELKAKLK